MRENQLQAVQVILGVLSGESLAALLPAVWARQPKLAPDDRGAIQDLCYGTLRHLAELRAYIELMSSKPLTDEAVRTIVCVALYQLAYTRNLPHAVVNEAVEAVRLLGKPQAKGLVNALLRRFQREHGALLERIASDPSKRFSYPVWWVRRVRSDHPDTYLALLEEGNRRPAMTLRVNRRQNSRAHYAGLLKTAGVDAVELGEEALVLDRPVPVERLPGFDRGWVSVQDYGAQCVPELLDVRAGMRVCDACAAPGGKTAHILEVSDVEMTALELDQQRMRRLSKTLERLQLRANLRCADAGDLRAWWDGIPFQRVLLDAPCSASGVVRRHPDSKWLRRDEDVPRFVVQQHRLLEALWQVVEPGGKLLYVTCSVFKAENEEVAARFLQAHTDATLIPATPPLDPTGHLMPSATHDGFFYATIQKRP